MVKCPSADSATDRRQKQYRIVFMGAAKVGKSSIVSQFLFDKFENRYRATVEDLYRGEYEVDGVDLTLDILDTSGAYEFPAMRKLSISSGDAFVLVFSVDDESSFEEVKKLRQLIIDEKNKENIPIVIVGNKIDLVDKERAVMKETAETIAMLDWRTAYIESSAKDNDNIVQIFKELLYQTDVHSSNYEVRRRESMGYPVTLNRRTSETRGRYDHGKRQSCVIS